MILDVYIRKNKTGEIRLYKDEVEEFNQFIWEEGNFSCDCNRALFYNEVNNNEDEPQDCSDGKFSVLIKDSETGEILYDELTPQTEREE